MTQNFPEDLGRQADPYTPAAARPISPTEERNWGALSHGVAGAATVLSAGTLGFVAALVIYVMYKDRGPFVREAAANSLNVQLNMLMWLIISVPLMLVLVGFVLYPVAVLIGVILHVLGAVKAMNGEWWKPPFTIRFVN